MSECQRPPFNPATRELTPAWHREWVSTTMAIRMARGGDTPPVMFRYWDDKVSI